MRKLLSLLGAATISGSTITTLGVQYAHKEQASVIKKLQNYIDVSSLLARATVLSQNPADVNGAITGGRGFSRNYASQYIDTRAIGDFFPNPDHLRGAPRDTKGRILLGSMFNYPITNTTPFIPELKDTNLSLNEPGVGKTGNDSLANTLGLVAGVLQLLLGIDFNEGLASTINGFLESGAIDNVGSSIRDSLGDIGNNYLRNPATKDWIFNEFAELWSEDDLKAAYPDKSFTDLTFSEVFTIRQNDFWKGISRILYSGYGESWVDADAQIMNATDSTGKANAAVTTQDGDIKVALNGVLIEGIAYLLRYLRTLGVFYDSLMNASIPLAQIKDRNHLFDRNLENGVWLRNQIAEGKYAKPENIVQAGSTNKQKISVWSQEKIGEEEELKYYQLINVQRLAQFFMKLLQVDLEQDPESYETQKVFALLFSVPLSEENIFVKDPEVDNPFADTILSPLLSSIINQLVDKLVDLPLGIKITGAGDLVKQLLGFLRVALSDSKPMWQSTYPITNNATVKASVINIINITSSDGPFSFGTYFLTIASQLDEFLNSFIGKLLPANIKETIGVVVNALKNFAEQIAKDENSSVPIHDQTFGNPFYSLMNGDLLPKIFGLIEETGLIQIPESLTKVLPNLNTLLTTPLSDVLGAFGLPLDSWPIYLYGLRDKTISEIVTTLGERFDTKRYLSLEDNQSYLLNTRSLQRLLQPLNDQVTITFKDTIPTGLEGLFTDDGKTNEVMAVLIAMAYKEQIATVTVANNPSASSSFVAYILGIKKTNDMTYGYREGSFFYALAQLFGHKNEETPPALNDISKITIQKIISGFNALVTWMNNTSIPEYINDVFTPHFVNGWTTKYIASSNVDRPEKAAFIEYNLIQKIDARTNLTFKVRLERDSWIPSEKSPWFNYGVWKLTAINKI